MHKTNKKYIQNTTLVEHHLASRKRLGDDQFSLIDHVVAFTGPLIPVAVFIQAYNVWVLGKSQGLSLITWSLMLIASVTMALYAIKHRTKPLKIVYIPLVVANLLVVCGIILH